MLSDQPIPAATPGALEAAERPFKTPEEVAAAAAMQFPRTARLDVRAVWQVTSMSLGIGIFAIPYSFLQLGAAHGAVWVVVMGSFACVALQRLLDLAAATGITSYEGLVEHAFGAAGKAAMAVITLVCTFIATLSYLGAACGLLVDLAVAFFIDFDVNTAETGVAVLSKAKNIVMLGVLCVVVLPRCLSRCMGDNAWISTGGVISMCVSSVFFVANCLVLMGKNCEPNCVHPPPAMTSSIADTLQYTATLAFSFSMVFAVFPVLEERVVDGQVANAVAIMKPAVVASIGLSCCVYLLVGLVGVFTFGTATKSIALNNLALSHPLTQVIFLVVGATTTLLVAIISFPVIASVELLAEMARPSRTLSVNTRPLIVTAIGFVAVLVDTFLPTKIAFALGGSLGLAMCAYIMPCLLFFKLDQRSGFWNRGVVAVVLLFGCVLFFGSTPVTVGRLIHGDSGPAPQPLSQLLCHSESAPPFQLWEALSIKPVILQ